MLSSDHADQGAKSRSLRRAIQLILWTDMRTTLNSWSNPVKSANSPSRL